MQKGLFIVIVLFIQNSTSFDFLKNLHNTIKEGTGSGVDLIGNGARNVGGFVKDNVYQPVKKTGEKVAENPFVRDVSGKASSAIKTGYTTTKEAVIDTKDTVMDMATCKELEKENKELIQQVFDLNSQNLVDDKEMRNMEITIENVKLQNKHLNTMVDGLKKKLLKVQVQGTVSPDELEKSNMVIRNLEDNLMRAQQEKVEVMGKNKRLLSRLEKLEIQSFNSEQGNNNTETDESLSKANEQLSEEMKVLREEISKLAGENLLLKDMNERLNKRANKAENKLKKLAKVVGNPFK